MADSQSSGPALYPIDAPATQTGSALESTPSYSSNTGRQASETDNGNPKKGPRPATGRSSSIRVEEGDVTAEHTRNNGTDSKHGGFSEKLSGLRQRAVNRGHRYGKGQARQSAIVKHARSKEYSTGLIGFAQRVGTVSYASRLSLFVELTNCRRD